MSGKNEDKNLVDLKDWKKRKDQQTKQEARAKSTQQTLNMSSPLVKKLVMVVFVLLILWLAMPKGYVDTLLQAVIGR